YICITFKVRKNGQLKTISTQAKMARGKMIHYMIKNKIETLADIRAFQEDGYHYVEELSSISEYVFVKENDN
ncbi:MAG: peroxide stress protein YaaA, partial [Erysipelotrichaceae bacterium]|nr:peroxide stress protein YaaA [Erysipelotrichaceae bacterium]